MVYNNEVYIEKNTGVIRCVQTSKERMPFQNFLMYEIPYGISMNATQRKVNRNDKNSII